MGSHQGAQLRIFVVYSEKAWETLRRIKTADEAVAFIKKFDWWTGTEWDLLMDLPAEEADAYLRLRGIVALADSVQQQRHLGRIEKGLPPEVEVDPLTMKEISSDVFDEDREAYGDPGGDSE